MIDKLLGKLKSRKQFIQVADAVSHVLRAAIIVLLILIVISQMAIQNDTIRHWLTDVDRLEGTRLE